MDHLASMFETRLQGTDLLRKEVSSQGVQDQIVNFLNTQLHEGLTGVNIDDRLVASQGGSRR